MYLRCGVTLIEMNVPVQLSALSLEWTMVSQATSSWKISATTKLQILKNESW